MNGKITANSQTRTTRFRTPVICENLGSDGEPPSEFYLSSTLTTKCLRVPDGLGPFDKPFLSSFLAPSLSLNSSCKNCARLQNFTKHYNFARHPAAAAGSENRRPGCGTKLAGDFPLFSRNLGQKWITCKAVKKRPPLLFFGLSLSLSLSLSFRPAVIWL